MRTSLFGLVFALVIIHAPRAHADSERPRWTLGTSVWMLANFLPDPGDFGYLEGERSVGSNGALMVAALTWRYHAPIGISAFSSSYGDAAEDYPGFVRSFGIGVGYRHWLYRGFNLSLWSFHLLQRYMEDGRASRTGYQLFLQGRVGWRFYPLDAGFWIEPALAFNAWPVESGRPDSFRETDERWPSYYLLEPWLNVGWSW